MSTMTYDRDGTASLSGGSPIPTTGRILYEGSDLREIHRQVSTHLAPHHLLLESASPLAAHFRLVHRGEVSLYVLAYGTDIEVIAGAGEFYQVHLAHTGGGALVVNDRQVPFSAAITGPGDRVTQQWAADTVALIARIPQRVVDMAVAKQLGHRPLCPVRFAVEIDETVPLSRRWLALATDFSEAAAVGMLHRSRFIQMHFEQMLVHGLLFGQRHNLSADLIQPTALPMALRLALDFCKTHVRDDLTVADIAEAAQTSIRRLQELFRKHLKTTPLTFLRRLRLAHAHDDLVALAAGEAEGSVTEVATRWGFTHLGRFGVLYRQVYGTVPSRTARYGAPAPHDRPPYM
ncbi:AraC family transcriptional regulator [Yinghuangia sp. ASG 101]|uniref:AraC family transcriptional regulator n=1 Tax=Yinghuangia sp. ASG 101 TaxID=2896848 RepID=UPI001E35CD05|nr:AraC family transcriptional regulator [Yinghuangia sp. ASG 101]UGQ11637.1 AraC family transcriptional regulator [Yinghuangia sp. ASG 101]